MKVAILIDGGYLRVIARAALARICTPDIIEAVAHACVDRADGERLFRVLYYDCSPFSGTVRLPVSGENTTFTSSDHWLKDLATRNCFAVRLGELKFRGFKPRQIPTHGRALTDTDFAPDFEQKGVDMRIGLDIATFAQTRAVERIVLITNDTDFVPAMKHARKAGLQVVLAGLPGQTPAGTLLCHADYFRPLADWPVPSAAA